MDLVAWTKTFVEHRDVIKRQIDSMEEKGNVLLVHHKNKNMQEYFIQNDLDNIKDILSAAKKSDKDQAISVFVVTANKQKNFDTLVKNWKQLAQHPKLTIYFVNTNSLSERKWVIKPWLHSKVSDPESLENGLKALFDTVEEVT